MSSLSITVYNEHNTVEACNVTLFMSTMLHDPLVPERSEIPGAASFEGEGICC